MDWTQHPLIRSIVDDCDAGTRRLEDWVGKGSGAVYKGGRPSKTTRHWHRPAEAERSGTATESAAAEGNGAAADGAVSRPRGRPRRPPPVREDSPEESPEQAAVHARLYKVDADSLRRMCLTILPNDGPWARRQKPSLVETLMPHHERLAPLFTCDAAMPPQAMAPTPAATAPTLASCIFRKALAAGIVVENHHRLLDPVFSLPAAPSWCRLI